MDPVPYTIVDAQDYPQEIAIATATKTIALGVRRSCAGRRRQRWHLRRCRPCVGVLTHWENATGTCAADADNDGICDDVDPCVGNYDALGICNGDCPADVDGDNVCDNAEVPGCTDEEPATYDEDATDEDGQLHTLDALETVAALARRPMTDGTCDDVDPCIGAMMRAACATAPGPSMIAAVLSIPQAIAIAKAM